MKLRRLLVVLCLTPALACSPEPAPVISRGQLAQQQEQVVAAPELKLQGRWRILSIDGRPPAPAAERERAPFLAFGNYSVGGSVGCNSFGGLGLLADGRYSIHSWESTAMACPGEIGDQEAAISKLFFARPRVSALGADRLRLKSDEHLVELQRQGLNHGQEVPTGPVELTGTSWRISMMDGQEASTEPSGRFLRFGSGTWQGMASCATLSGTWRREGDRIRVGRQIVTTEQLCPAKFAAIDEAFAALMRSDPRYLVGPNGEILIAGGGHALAGGRAN